MNSLNCSFEGACDRLISVASWEERFSKGFERALEATQPPRATIFFLEEWASWTSANQELVARQCAERQIALSRVALSYNDQIGNWKRIRDTLSDIRPGERILVDITTAPREITWNIFDHVIGQGALPYFIYWQPAAYNRDWISRDPGRPRLTLMHGGVSEFGKKTLLCLSLGYDTARVLQLINFFEPARVGIFAQVDDDPKAVEHRVDEIQKCCGIPADIQNVDFCAPERARAEVEAYISGHIGENNVIMSSLGPKASAVTFYEVALANKHIALAYSPSNEFNPDYSSGIANCVCGLVGV